MQGKKAALILCLLIVAFVCTANDFSSKQWLGYPLGKILVIMIIVIAMEGPHPSEGACPNWDIDAIGCKKFYTNSTRDELVSCLKTCAWKRGCSYVTFTFGEHVNACFLEDEEPDWSEKRHGTLYLVSSGSCKATMLKNHGCLETRE